jgi:VIT1/CCC1 family predicted Fe2+/Mn2+ transporter
MADTTGTIPGSHSAEPHTGNTSGRLNWLRAGVLGANDGIVSVAALVVGVAGATRDSGPIATAGIAALVGGAISMALGEYVSVSSQRDSQHALIEKERRELAEEPERELVELSGLYEAKGLSPQTARLVATELTEKDALKAHLDIELGIDETEVVSAWNAAGASAIAFLVGGVLPLIAILLPPADIRVPITFVVVLAALAATGSAGASIGGSGRMRATIRVVAGGAIALGVTFLLGSLLGTSGIV